MEINAVSKGMTTSMKKSIGTRDDDGGGGNKSKHMHAYMMCWSPLHLCPNLT